MPGSVLVSGAKMGIKADEVPALCGPRPCRLCAVLIQLKYTCLYLEVHVEPLTTKFPRTAKSHDWVMILLLSPRS